MKNRLNIQNTKYFILAALFLAAFLERAVWDLGPNFELVTTVMILASIYYGGKSAFWLTFLIMAASDRLIGNSNIFLFTWSGFLIPAIFTSSILKKLFSKIRLPSGQVKTKLGLALGLGLSSNIFFYLWTNFGVWLLDSWGMYPKTPTGLLMSYINAIPFLKNQFISSFIFIPMGILLIESAFILNKKIVKNTIKAYKTHC